MDRFEISSNGGVAGLIEQRRLTRRRAPADIEFLSRVQENPDLLAETLVRVVYDMRLAMDGTRIKNWKRRLLHESILRIEQVIFAEQQRTNLD